MASILQGEVLKEIPGWTVPIRMAPLAVLSSATMPSLVFEIGNLNNTLNAQTLLDGGFEGKIVNIITNAIQRYSELPQPVAN